MYASMTPVDTPVAIAALEDGTMVEIDDPRQIDELYPTAQASCTEIDPESRDPRHLGCDLRHPGCSLRWSGCEKGCHGCSPRVSRLQPRISRRSAPSSISR